MWPTAAKGLLQFRTIGMSLEKLSAILAALLEFSKIICVKSLENMYW